MTASHTQRAANGSLDKGNLDKGSSERGDSKQSSSSANQTDSKPPELHQPQSGLSNPAAHQAAIAIQATQATNSNKTSNLSVSYQHLVNVGLVTQAQAENAVLFAAQESHHTAAMSQLVDAFNADAEQISESLAKHFFCATINLNDTPPDAALVTQYAELIQATHALPIKLQQHNLILAVVDPLANDAIHAFGQATQAYVDVVLVNYKELASYLAQHLNLKIASHIRQGKPATTRDRHADDHQIIDLVEQCFAKAIRKHASDIHFEPMGEQLRVRMRIDGLLTTSDYHPLHLSAKIITRLKVLAKLDIAERRLPQDGRIVWQPNEFAETAINNTKHSADEASQPSNISNISNIDMRISFCPVLNGEKAVIRILHNAASLLSPSELGMTPLQSQQYQRASNQSQGLILVTGPTGSGKTVTQYAALHELNQQHRNISTAEDPVEIVMDGINQVHINPKIGLTFASAMRAFLRQDPDVIMIGEIRDLDTAEMAVKASQTGHLVFSTLHTNDAPQSLTRLENIGVAPHNIASSVSLIIAQRLARKLCLHCRQPDERSSTQQIDISFKEQAIFRANTSGCRHCDAGYQGRTGVFQVLPISDDMRELMLSEHDSRAISDLAEEEGIGNLMQHGMELVRTGITDIDEIHRVLSH